VLRNIYDIGFVIPNFSDNIDHSAFSIYAASFCHFDAFLLGALLANYEKSLIAVKNLPINFFASACLVAGVYAISYAVINIKHGASGIDIIKNIYSGNLYGQNRQLWVYSVVDLSASAIMLLTLAKNRFTLWLSNPWLSWVGRVSFGGYLLHVFVLWMFTLVAGIGVGELSLALRVISFVFIWLITVTIAGLSFKFYEQPVAKRLKNWATPYRKNN
jgi:peptidoglycan/LPS O-acetylase OafA/YrhL